MPRTPARKKSGVKVLRRKESFGEPKPRTKKPQSTDRQIKKLTLAVSDLASAFAIQLSSIQQAIKDKRNLQQMIGEHIMIDLIQQSWLPEKLNSTARWDRMLHAVESAIEESRRTEKPEWTNSEDIHKIIQYINSSVA